MKEKHTQIEVIRYSKRGHGIGLLEPQKTQVEVTGGVVGDLLQVAVGKKRRGARVATLLAVLKASEDRVTPRCQHAFECGGCSLQQVDYQAQLKHKEEQVRKFFQPLLNGVTFQPILGCKEPWGYRNKMEFSFSQSQDKTRFLGLNIGGARGRVLNLEACHLVAPWFLTALQATKAWWEGCELDAYHPPSDTGTLRTLTLREGKRTGKKMIILTVTGNHDHFLKNEHLKGFKNAILNAMPDENPSLFLRIHRTAKGKPSEFYEMHLHGPDTLHEMLHLGERTVHYHLSPSSFFQPNTLQAEELFLKALEIAELKPSDRVYDLYCGIGTFGTLFAPLVKKVIGIEENPYAVCDAQMTIEVNDLHNFSIIKGDVGEVLAKFQLKADLVVLDPPRAGLNPTALKHVLRLAPQKILYVSCNPETQSQNIFEFVKSGYQLKTLQPVDQFPHTPHIENIAYLELKASNNGKNSL